MKQRVLTVLCGVLALISLLPPTSARGASEPATSFHFGKIHIVLAGDSTVTDNAGWGKGFAGAMKQSVKFTNLAKGGRSSSRFIKRFLEEGFESQTRLSADPVC